MADIELTKACAEAMGWHTGKPARQVVAYNVSDCAIIAGNDKGGESVYDPLHDDAQCFALVKRFHLYIDPDLGMPGTWQVAAVEDVIGTDLNRCICECVAKLKGAG